jgi:DNA-binding response OmpR family regulator
MRIAILEDDPSQALVLQHCLMRAGHLPVRYERGTDLIKAMESGPFDLLLLDWEVPDISGLEVLNRVRKELKLTVPTLLVTARTSEEDIVQGLQEGADDFIAKPYRPAELLARIDSVGRRNKQQTPAEEPLSIGKIHVDFASRRISRNGTPVELSTKDFDLAVFLLRRIGRLVPRQQLQESVWGEKAVLTSRTLDTHISRIRNKLWLTEENGWRLGAVYGHGYRLERIGGR